MTEQHKSDKQPKDTPKEAMQGEDLLAKYAKIGELSEKHHHTEDHVNGCGCGCNEKR